MGCNENRRRLGRRATILVKTSILSLWVAFFSHAGIFKEVPEFLGDPRPRSWKRTAHSAETRLHALMGRIESSPAYELLAILAVVASIVSFGVWLLA